MENLNSDWQSLPHFRQRLGGCSKHVRAFNERIAKIDRNLDNNHSGSHNLALKALKSCIPQTPIYSRKHSHLEERSGRLHVPFGSQPWIQVCFVLRFKFLFSDCMLRGGPTITKLFNVVETSCSRINYRSIGFGLKFVLCLPKIFRKRLSAEVMIVWKPMFHRMRFATFWDLDCARIMQQQAKIFRYVRTGSIDGVRRFVKSGQASVRDKTITISPLCMRPQVWAISTWSDC